VGQGGIEFIKPATLLRFYTTYYGQKAPVPLWALASITPSLGMWPADADSSMASRVMKKFVERSLMVIP